MAFKTSGTMSTRQQNALSRSLVDAARAGPEKATAGKQVPIGAILDIEFGMLGFRPDRRQAARQAYESHVAKLINALPGYMGMSQGFGGEALRAAVSGTEENRLFPSISKAFRTELEVSFTENSAVATAVEDRRFNCYSSTVFLADALARLGKSVEVVTAPGHIFLTGAQYTFETTAFSTPLVFNVHALNAKYPFYQRTGVEMLVSSAWNNKGTELEKKGWPEQAIMAYESALELNPNDAEVLYNLGITLTKLGRFDEAIIVSERFLEISPKESVVLNNYAALLRRQGRFFASPAAVNRASKC